MKYADIRPCDIADGPGVRVALYVSGCSRRCPGCHNQAAQAFDYGKPFTQNTIEELLLLVASPYCAGLSILGGEPMEGDNRATVIALCKEVKERFPEKDIWMWTGYTYEELLADEMAREIFSHIDYVVDGPYIEAQRDLSLAFRGSANQRILKLHPAVEDVSRIF